MSSGNEVTKLPERKLDKHLLMILRTGQLILRASVSSSRTRAMGSRLLTAQKCLLWKLFQKNQFLATHKDNHNCYSWNNDMFNYEFVSHQLPGLMDSLNTASCWKQRPQTFHPGSTCYLDGLNGIHNKQTWSSLKRRASQWSNNLYLKMDAHLGCGSSCKVPWNTFTLSVFTHKMGSYAQIW